MGLGFCGLDCVTENDAHINNIYYVYSFSSQMTSDVTVTVCHMTVHESQLQLVRIALKENQV